MHIRVPSFMCVPMHKSVYMYFTMYISDEKKHLTNTTLSVSVNIETDRHISQWHANGRC